MKVIDAGHTYLLDDNKSPTNTTTLTFMKDAKINGDGYEGTTNQEVLRALIDRIKFLEGQVHHRFNDDIIGHLRMALVLHEERHLERLVERGESIENIKPKITGHFV